jgi:hypothetical protein
LYIRSSFPNVFVPREADGNGFIKEELRGKAASPIKKKGSFVVEFGRFSIPGILRLPSSMHFLKDDLEILNAILNFGSFLKPVVYTGIAI